jgi:hypothetical protein
VDISNALLWLASDESRYVTRVTLPIDVGVLVNDGARMTGAVGHQPWRLINAAVPLQAAAARRPGSR